MKKLFLPLLILLALNVFSQSNIEVGAAAPEIHITDWIANTPADQNLSDKYIVLEFWATWCGPCIKAVPHMNELQKKFDRNDLYYLSLTDESVEKVNRTLKRIDFHSIVVSDQTRQTKLAYGDGENGLESLPMTVLIDQEGIIRWIGLPSQLTAEVMRDFLAGRLEGFNHFDEKGAASFSINNVTITEASSKEETGSATSTPQGGFLSLLTLVKDNDILQYFDFRKTSRTDNSTSNVGNFGLNFTAARLADILAKIWDVDPGNVEIPDSLQRERYYLMYKNARPGAEGFERLGTEILNVLNLEKAVSEKPVTVYQVAVTDESLLEETMETEFSSNSSTGEKIIFSAYSIPDMLDEITEDSEATFTTAEDSEVKYDFIIDVSSTEEMLESLKSYGLEAEQQNDTVEIIRVKFKK